MQARTQDMLTLRLIKLYPFRPSVRLSYGQDRPFKIYTLSGATSRKAFQNAQGTDASLHTVYSGNPRSQEVFPFGRTFQPIDCPLVPGFCSLDPTWVTKGPPLTCLLGASVRSHLGVAQENLVALHVCINRGKYIFTSCSPQNPTPYWPPLVVSNKGGDAFRSF